MQNDKLYFKSVTALFIIAVFGISLFLVENNLNNKNQEAKKIDSENQFDALNNQIPKNSPESKEVKIPKLEGFQNLSEETEKIGDNDPSPPADGNIDELLKNF